MPPFHKLTNGQIECLRFVRDGLSSKEIALRLGRQKAAIDDRIERAVAALGAENRKTAARWLADFEAGGTDRKTPDSSSYDTPDRIAPDAERLDPTEIIAPPSLLDGTWSKQALIDREHLREEQARFLPGLLDDDDRNIALPYGGERNELRPLQRIGLVFAIALGVVFGFRALVAAYDILNGIVRHAPH